MVEVLHAGYGSKEGGRIKTWKRRYFVLRTATDTELETAPDGLSHFLVYYKERPAFLEIEPAGAMQLFQGRSTACELVRKNSRAVKVTTPVYGNRDFFFIPEDRNELWLKALNTFEVLQDSEQLRHESLGSRPVFEVNATVLATDADDDDDDDDDEADGVGGTGAGAGAVADTVDLGYAPVLAPTTVVVARTMVDQSFGVRFAMETNGDAKTLGVIVTAVAPGTPASTAGLTRGSNVINIASSAQLGGAVPLAGLTVPELSAAISAATTTALRIRLDIAPNLALTHPPAVVAVAATSQMSWPATVARDGTSTGFGVVLCGASPIIGEGWVGSVADQVVFVSRVVAGSAAAAVTNLQAGNSVTSINGTVVVDIHQAAKLLASAGKTLVLELAAGLSWLTSPAASTKATDLLDATPNCHIASTPAAVTESASEADSAALVAAPDASNSELEEVIFTETNAYGGTLEC